MDRYVKVQEVRPDPCGSRIGDLVLTESGDLMFQVKCRKCTKDSGKDHFHYVHVSHLTKVDH